ncbi:MAG TPA: PAS domain S-box protein, partial [Ignavibacteria bacterium]|nr:PAS domain S-box protein [Ignavibacteria bacterium]
MILQEQIRNDDYKQIFQFAPSAIIEIDDSGCILNYNLSAASLLSLIREDIRNSNLIDIASSESREKISSIISDLLNNKIEGFTGLEAEFETHDLSILTLLLKFSVIESIPEDEKRIFVTLEDISKYKEDQQYYRRYFEEIQITRDDLEVRTSELAMLNEKL